MEVRGYRLYSEGQSPTYPGTRDYILTGVGRGELSATELGVGIGGRIEELHRRLVIFRDLLKSRRKLRW